MVRPSSMVLAAALALAVPSSGRAQCTESSPLTGVVINDCTEGGTRWVAVTADLSSADVGVRVTRPEEREQPITDWAAGIGGAVVAVQGGPFTFPSYEAVGLTVGAGEAWEGRDDARLSMVAFDARGAGLIPPAEQIVPFEPWMHDVVSGVPVLRDNVVTSPCAGRGCEPMPRTAVGLGDDGRTLVVVVVEGWTADSAGVTDPELGELARNAGATSAVRTGEGSTSLMWAGGGVLVPSSDGSARPAASFLAITDRGSGETARIRGIVKSNEDGMPVLPGARITIETIDGTRVVENSPTMTTGAYFEYALPVRDYFVLVSHTGYRTSCKYCPLTTHDMGELWCSAFLSPGEGAETCQAPRFGVDAGPWPEGSPDAGADGGRRDAGTRPPVEPGCAIAGRRDSPVPALLLGFALALAVRRKVLT